MVTIIKVIGICIVTMTLLGCESFRTKFCGEPEPRIEIVYVDRAVYQCPTELQNLPPVERPTTRMEQITDSELDDDGLIIQAAAVSCLQIKQYCIRLEDQLKATAQMCD